MRRTSADGSAPAKSVSRTAPITRSDTPSCERVTTL